MLGCVNSNSVIVGRLRERCHLILLRSFTSSWSLDTFASEVRPQLFKCECEVSLGPQAFQEHDTSHGSITDPMCSSTEQECFNEVGNPLIRSAFRYRRLGLKPRYTTKSEAKILDYRSPKNFPISIGCRARRYIPKSSGCRVRRYISTPKAVHDHHVAEDVWVRKNTATNTADIKSIESYQIEKELQPQGYPCRQREILVHYYGKKFRRRGDILNELQEKRVGRQNKMDKDVLSIFSTSKPEGEGVREEDQITEEPEIELVQGRDGTIARHHMNSKIGMVAHDRAFEKLARFSERTVKSARHAQYPLELGTRAFTTNAVSLEYLGMSSSLTIEYRNKGLRLNN